MHIKQTFLAQGNIEIRNGNYLAAITLFEKSIQQTPALEEVIRFNIALAETKMKTAKNEVMPTVADSPITESSDLEKIQCTALIITCDKNPSLLKRAVYLAERLDEFVKNTVVTSFQTRPKKTGSLEEFNNNSIPFIKLQWHSLPKLLEQ